MPTDRFREQRFQRTVPEDSSRRQKTEDRRQGSLRRFAPGRERKTERWFFPSPGASRRKLPCLLSSQTSVL
ncbi:MAG: hypothetical protein LBD06_05675 [Candidatus Accumulibacter sp.]|nr:hypothetical protein [Accumulibacter sp.]